MITLKDVFKQLIRDVRSEKLRTFLTVFGIVCGPVAQPSADPVSSTATHSVRRRSIVLPPSNVANP